MSTLEKFYAGAEYQVAYPFSRDKYMAFPDDPEGMPVEKIGWRPGVIFDQMDDGDAEAYADAMGSVIYTVVAVFKPGSFPERIFYTRHWIDPDGRRFGKGKLRITTTQNFRVLLRGYRHHFDMAEAA